MGPYIQVMLAQGQVMGGLKRTHHHSASWRPTFLGALWEPGGEEQAAVGW